MKLKKAKQLLRARDKLARELKAARAELEGALEKRDEEAEYLREIDARLLAVSARQQELRDLLELSKEGEKVLRCNQQALLDMKARFDAEVDVKILKANTALNALREVAAGVREAAALVKKVEALEALKSSVAEVAVPKPRAGQRFTLEGVQGQKRRTMPIGMAPLHIAMARRKKR